MIKQGEKSENRLFTLAFGKDQENQLLYFSIDISLILVIIAFVLKNANDLQMHCICNLKRYDRK